MKIKHILLYLFIGLATYSYGQGVRVSMQMGVAIPVGKFEMSATNPDSAGFARTGFNINLLGERFSEKGLVVGGSLGYSVFGMDKDAIRQAVSPQNPNAITVETQSYQNFTLLGRIGYEFRLFEEKFQIVLVLDAGLGIFNSAYYLIEDNTGNQATRSGNTDINVLVSPGMEFWIPLNSFTNVKLYSHYQSANYTVEETFTNNGMTILSNTPITYNFSALTIGLGITATF